MEFDGTFDVASSPSETWDFVLDPEELGGCIPNCQDVDVVDDTHYTATIGIEISYISATFDSNIEILEQEEEEYVKVELTGDAEEGDSGMSATGEMYLVPREDGPGTHVDYEVEMNVTGRVMNMGSRLVKSVAKRQVKKTIDNIQEALGAPE
ncbi:CoxG family protein [Halocalculus aciditolerans]|uniref:Carbon monoxide dehydrogenase subunit G n=1 Tax=Halocalculus aciditolerans TaxID=1383812 RepID=A0A830FEU4_9EURY|nr:SRPBCC domain-containing protein [Halocalculus aciditolerans]GGL67738.1 hypothetical protein GCM10009039_27140 [Halocalculus aciditolerans]